MRALLLVAACSCAHESPRDVHPLEGRWHSLKGDATWERVGSTLWGVAFDERGFTVNYIDGTPLALTSLEHGDKSQTFALGSKSASAMLAGMVRADARRVPAIEDADRRFAADTARDGADGWVRHFDEHGAMWRDEHRVERDDLRASIATTLGAGALRWDPVTSGAHADLGFTLGAATFTVPGGAPRMLTYCTIWKHEPDGSWKVLFDIGLPVE